MRLEDVQAGIRVDGIVPGEPVAVIAAAWHGTEAVELTYKKLDGTLSQQVLYRSDESALIPVVGSGRPFDADGRDFKLVAEAQRIKLAGPFDPMLAVATSDVQPLPHQIRAVYGERADPQVRAVRVRGELSEGSGSLPCRLMVAAALRVSRSTP